MKIAIDVSQVIYGTGVSQYTDKLVKYLLKIDKENEYLLYAGVLRRKSELLNIFPQARVFPIPPSISDLLWNRLHLFPIEKIIGSVDVFHSSDWTQPPSIAFKVTTVHDLIPIKFPKIIHKDIVSTHARRLEWVRREVNVVIVPSASTANDLNDYGIKSDRIRIIPEAPFFTRASVDEVGRVKKEFKITGEYLVGFASGAYKNVENTVRAFEYASAGKNLKLILIGRQSGIFVKESRNVRFTGYLPINKVQALFSGASGLVFASLYEGFGQPILEAFACGIPVVTSTTSSMPEVAGGAAVLVEPTSIDSIAEGISKILRGPKLYIDKGSKRVQDFSWEKTAKETLKVYKEYHK